MQYVPPPPLHAPTPAASPIPPHQAVATFQHGVEQCEVIVQKPDAPPAPTLASWFTAAAERRSNPTPKPPCGASRALPTFHNAEHAKLVEAGTKGLGFSIPAVPEEVSSCVVYGIDCVVYGSSMCAANDRLWNLHCTATQVGQAVVRTHTYSL